jgi:predicted acyl esterase
MRHSGTVILALAAMVATAAPALAALDVQVGIGFVAVKDAPPATQIALDDASHHELQQGVSDSFGSLIFRDLGEGNAYFLRDVTNGGDPQPLTTLELEDHPDQSFYAGQTLGGGLQYIEMRDGTLLAAMVRPPLGKTLAQGPFPTVIEYSGYAAADPDSPQASTLLASGLGYATVGVNMRGSGCSGGVLDLFDLPTTADGYDIVEAVAAQSWVKNHAVGMVGISFPGISQLFVAGARPPHLAAVAPFSTIADIYRAPGFPGGIFNNGFAQSWLQERKDDARPAPQGGQGWARKRVNQGDQTCLANQRLRLQTQDPIEFTESHPYYVPELMDARSPINWVSGIEVPMFYAAAFQDEQTGGDFASMLRKFPRRRDVKISVINGVHASPMEPAILWNWIAFLDLYVAKQIPDPSRAALFAGIIYGQILEPGAPIPPLPADRWDGIASYAAAKKLFEDDPHVRVLMENGAGTATVGLPAPTYELGYTKWPPPKARPVKYYFGEDGTLTRRRAQRGSDDFDTYRPDPEARPMQTLPGQGQSESWVLVPPYAWDPYPANTAVAYVTDPLADDVTVVGPGSVDLWLRSSAADTDIQVTLSEVRPDGKETYVQSGWLRASHRKLDRRSSSRLEPRPTHLEQDAEPMPGGFTLVRVGLFASAHVFRKDSRIRISLEAPGGDRTRWAFDTFLTQGSVVNDVARTYEHASRVVLPVVPNGDAPEALPPCQALRGEPCRTYVPASNGG